MADSFADLPMFASATAVGLAACERTAARHARDIARLIPIAVELAARAGAAGVTVADVRLAAVQRGVLTGAEVGRQLSYLGKVMEAAGLERTTEYRRSFLAKSNGNLHRVHRLPGAA